MRRLWCALLAVAVLAAPALLAGPASSEEQLAFPDGVMSGDVTETRAVIWTRTNSAAAVRVEYGISPALGQQTVDSARTEAAADFTAKLDLGSLQPGTRYYYRTVADAADSRAASLVGSFKTAPAPTEAADVDFVWGADLSEHFKPFRIFDVMRAKDPDFFLFLGDTVYADIDANARRLEEYRTAYRRNRDDEALQKFFRVTSVYAIWDDHEVSNNFDRTHERLPIGRQAFLEYWPIRPDPGDATRLYRSFRWGKLVEIFILDTRQYRSPPYERDTPAKTMLGEAQRDWLKRGLQASDAVFKVIVTSVPLKYHGADSWEGYTTERQELFDFLTQGKVRGVVFLAADVHYAAVLRYKEGFVEAIAGPLAQLISRRRSAAGEAETEFTDNSAFTFGLVRVTARPASMVIELYNVEGNLLHRTTIQPEGTQGIRSNGQQNYTPE